jgi:hypothetical protein
MSYRKNMTSDELYSNQVLKNQIKTQGNVYNTNTEKNYYKNTYETQYTKSKQDFEKKRSNRRHTAKSIDFMCSHNNILGSENLVVEDVPQKNNKKLFETVYYKKSLQNLYRGEKENKYNPPHQKQEILHALKTKKHFVIFFHKNITFIYIKESGK